jgi:hypothetical protein
MGYRYAEKTEVPVERSRQQLDAYLRQHGAKGFACGWTDTEDRIEFLWNTCQIRFTLPRAKPDDFAFTAGGVRRAPTQARQAMDKADRQRWRALFLVVKAKIEAVESGIAVFEREFLGFIVMPDGDTIGDVLVPRIEAGELPSGKLLLAAKK